MAGLGTADFAAALKTLYVGPLNDQVVRSHVLLDRLEKTAENVSGNFAYIPLVSARNPAVGSRKDPATTSSVAGPALPVAGRQSYSQATYTMGLHYGRGTISGSVKRKSREDSGAFARALQTEMEGLMKSLPDDLNRQVCGNGTGRVASIEASGSTAAVECSSYVNFQVKIGDRVTIATASAGTVLATLPNGALVSSIAFDQDKTGVASTTKHTVILDTSAGAFTTASVLYSGNNTNAVAEDFSRGQDIYGLQTLIDNSDIGTAELYASTAAADISSGEILAGPGDSGDATKIGGIVRSSNAFWQSVVKRNPAGAGTLRPLTQNIIFEAWLNATAQQGAKPQNIEIYMEPGMWGTLGMVEVGGRVYNDFTDTVEMGWTYIKVMGSKAFYDRDLPRNQIFYLDMSKLMLLTQNGYELIDDDGNVLRMVSGGNRDAWEFAVNRDIQFAAKGLRSHIRVMDVASVMSLDGSLH